MIRSHTDVMYLVMVLSLAGCERPGLNPIQSDDTDSDTVPDRDTGTDTDTDTDSDTDSPPECPSLDAPERAVDDPVLCEISVPLSEPVLEWSFVPPGGHVLTRSFVGPMKAAAAHGVVLGAVDVVDYEHMAYFVDGNTGSLIDTMLSVLPLALARRSDTPEFLWAHTPSGLVHCSTERCRDVTALRFDPDYDAVPADLNHDGTYALLFGEGYQPSDGGRFVGVHGSDSGMTAAFDLDSDGVDEVFFATRIEEGRRTLCETVANSTLAVADQSGGRSIVASGTFAVHVGKPCSPPDVVIDLGGERRPLGLAAGDIDGDGASDVVYTFVRRPDVGERWIGGLAAFRLDGERLWVLDDFPADQLPFRPALADLDGDGSFEVLGPGPAVYAGETGRRLFDLGDTWEWRGGSNEWKVNDAILPVDVDRDGALEILVRRHDRLDVYGGTTPWAAGPTVWHSGGFWGTNVNPDLTIPKDPVWPWESHNSFRAATGHGPITGAGTDLAARFVRVCEVECDREIARIGIQAGNLGEAPVQYPTDLVLTGYLGTTPFELHRERYASMPAATWLEGIDVEVPVSTHFDDLQLSLEPLGWEATRECDGAEATLTWGATVCE